MKEYKIGGLACIEKPQDYAERQYRIKPPQWTLIAVGEIFSAPLVGVFLATETFWRFTSPDGQEIKKYCKGIENAKIQCENYYYELVAQNLILS